MTLSSGDSCLSFASEEEKFGQLLLSSQNADTDKDTFCQNDFPFPPWMLAQTTDAQ